MVRTSGFVSRRGTSERRAPVTTSGPWVERPALPDLQLHCWYASRARPAYRLDQDGAGDPECVTNYLGTQTRVRRSGLGSIYNLVITH